MREEREQRTSNGMRIGTHISSDTKRVAAPLIPYYHPGRLATKTCFQGAYAPQSRTLGEGQPGSRHQEAPLGFRSFDAAVAVGPQFLSHSHQQPAAHRNNKPSPPLPWLWGSLGVVRSALGERTQKEVNRQPPAHTQRNPRRRKPKTIVL